MITTKRYKEIEYYVFEADGQTAKKPVIIHIHGAGSRGNDISVAIKSNPIVKYFEEDKKFPFMVYAPQCRADTWFDIYEQLLEFIDFVKESEGTDKLFLSGISMGGYCSWQLLMSRPQLFEKAVICCGGGMYWNAGRIKTPVKAFCGALDTTVLPEESKKMVDAVNAKGGRAELIVYDDLGHNVWDRVYSDEKNYEWFLK